MSNNLNILFLINTAKTNLKGLTPIHLRLTHLKTRKTISTGKFVTEAKWDSVKQRVKGTDENAEQINSYLIRTRSRLVELFTDMLCEGDVYLEKLLDKFLGRDQKHISLMELVTRHNEIFKSKIDIDYSLSTYKKYSTTKEKIQQFLIHKFKKPDVRLKDLDIQFMEEFEFFQKSVLKTHHNTTVKHCKNLKKIVNEAVRYGWLEKSPFSGFKTSYEDTDKIYLAEHEIRLIENKSFSIKRLDLVKDLFLFQCFTGLAYADMEKLKKTDISLGIDGNKWIIIRRKKTNVRSTIPLLPEALTILEKYKSFDDGEKLLPVYTNQKYNSYLKEISDICGITKKLTTHVGRRTFGNLALANGISLNVIAKVLGHSNTLITQKIYAVTNDQLVSKEMKKLKRS